MIYLGYNLLADIKNDNLQEKEDLTDRYRRAGATLSTQCVTLQSSTHQVRLPEIKKRRLIMAGPEKLAGADQKVSPRDGGAGVMIV
jgi:hypothetical protein